MVGVTNQRAWHKCYHTNDDLLTTLKIIIPNQCPTSKSENNTICYQRKFDQDLGERIEYAWGLSKIPSNAILQKKIIIFLLLHVITFKSHI